MRSQRVRWIAALVAARAEGSCFGRCRRRSSFDRLRTNGFFHVRSQRVLRIAALVAARAEGSCSGRCRRRSSFDRLLPRREGQVRTNGRCALRPFGKLLPRREGQVRAGRRRAEGEPHPRPLSIGERWRGGGGGEGGGGASPLRQAQGRLFDPSVLRQAQDRQAQDRPANGERMPAPRPWFLSHPPAPGRAGSGGAAPRPRL